MQFGEVIVGGVYGTAGYVGGPQDVAASEAIIGLSLDVLRTFSHVIVATNYPEDGREALITATESMWRSHLPHCTFIHSPVNRGHSIGTADLDNALFQHCKRAGMAWLCKGSSDVSLSEDVLGIPVVPAAFYYLNAVSYAAIREHDLELEPFTDGFFYPQTTFYAIDVRATDYLVDTAFLDRTWRHIQTLPDYNGRIWEYLPGWSCEALLRACVLRNDLSRCHLMTDKQWRRVLELVVSERIDDCSFKGLSINGVCHTQGLIDPSAPIVV